MNNIHKQIENSVGISFRDNIQKNIWRNVLNKLWGDGGRPVYQNIHTNIHTRIRINIKSK